MDQGNSMEAAELAKSTYQYISTVISIYGRYIYTYTIY